MNMRNKHSFHYLSICHNLMSIALTSIFAGLHQDADLRQDPYG